MSDVAITGTSTAEPVVRMLVIEDSDTDFLLVKRQLIRQVPEGQISRASNRSEFMTALTQRWDVIVSDYHLTDIEGAELLALIAAAQPATPCLLVSGSIREWRDIALPENCVALEKGDHAGLRIMLQQILGKH
jgi:CheY-like chemotaxis protein